MEICLEVKYVPWEKNVRLRRSNKNNKTRLSSSGFTPASKNFKPQEFWKKSRDGLKFSLKFSQEIRYHKTRWF